MDFSGMTENQILTAVIAGEASEGAATILGGIGIALITILPKPRLRNRGRVPMIKDTADFDTTGLLKGNWIVLGATGSGKTAWLKKVVSSTQKEGTSVLVIGNQAEYGFEAIPPSILDLRIALLAAKRQVETETFRDLLSPAQLQVLSMLIGSTMVSYETLQRLRTFDARLGRDLEEFPKATKNAVLDFCTNLTEKVKHFAEIFRGPGRVVGIDASSTRSEDRLAFGSLLEMLPIVFSENANLLVVIDSIESYVATQTADQPTIHLLERLASIGRKRGLALIVSAQTIHPYLDRFASVATGVVSFTLRNSESIRQFATAWSVDQSYLDLIRVLPIGSFVVLSDMGPEGVYVQ